MTIASLFDHPALTPPSRQFRGGDNVLRLSDPADGSPVADLALDADLDKAVATAKTALPGWAGLTPQERASRLLQLADMVERHADELVMIESRNVGKPITAAREEVMPWVDTLRFTAGAARVAHGGGRRVRGGRVVVCAEGANRSRRADHAVELPSTAGGVESCAGVGSG